MDFRVLGSPSSWERHPALGSRRAPARPDPLWLASDPSWVAPLVQCYLSNAATLVLCVVCSVRDHPNSLHCSPLLKKACVRQVVLDKCFPRPCLGLEEDRCRTPSGVGMQFGRMRRYPPGRWSHAHCSQQTSFSTRRAAAHEHTRGRKNTRADGAQGLLRAILPRSVHAASSRLAWRGAESSQCLL